MTTTKTPPPCAWCGEPATGRRQIEPAVVRKEVVVKPARSVDVCDRHAEIIDRDTRISALRQQVRRDEGTLRRGNLRAGTLADLEGRLAAAQAELARLNGGRR
jgi:hypothetical protein